MRDGPVVVPLERVSSTPTPSASTTSSAARDETSRTGFTQHGRPVGVLGPGTGGGEGRRGGGKEVGGGGGGRRAV